MENDIRKFEDMRRDAEPQEPFDENCTNNTVDATRAADEIDNSLKMASEDAYIHIAEKIVENSCEQLRAQNDDKNELKSKFTGYFVWFITAQYAILVILIFIKAFYTNNNLSDTVIITYITSVFAETLGALVIMIKYAYDSKQEVNILQILNNVIACFQKFK